MQKLLSKNFQGTFELKKSFFRPTIFSSEQGTHQNLKILGTAGYRVPRKFQKLGTAGNRGPGKSI